MKNKIKLIAQAAYLNPFSEEREKIDKQIIGENKNYSYKKLIKKVVDITSKTIPKLKSKNINDYSGEEKQDIVYLFLFDVYPLLFLQRKETVESMGSARLCRRNRDYL